MTSASNYQSIDGVTADVPIPDEGGEEEEETTIITTTTRKVVDSHGRTQSITTKTVKVLPDGSNIIETTTKNISRTSSRVNSLSSGSHPKLNSLTMHQNLKKIDEHLSDFDYDYQVDSSHLDDPRMKLHLNLQEDNTKHTEPQDIKQLEPEHQHLKPALSPERAGSIVSSGSKPLRSILKNSRASLDLNGNAISPPASNPILPKIPQVTENANTKSTSMASPVSSIKFDNHPQTIHIPPNPKSQAKTKANSKAKPATSSPTKEQQSDADLYAAAMKVAYQKVYGNRETPVAVDETDLKKAKEKYSIANHPGEIPEREKHYTGHNKGFAIHSMRDNGNGTTKKSTRKERAKEEKKMAKEKANEEKRIQKQLEVEAKKAEKSKKNKKLKLPSFFTHKHKHEVEESEEEGERNITQGVVEGGSEMPAGALNTLNSGSFKDIEEMGETKMETTVQEPPDFEESTANAVDEESSDERKSDDIPKEQEWPVTRQDETIENPSAPTTHVKDISEVTSSLEQEFVLVEAGPVPALSDEPEIKQDSNNDNDEANTTSQGDRNTNVGKTEASPDQSFPRSVNTVNKDVGIDDNANINEESNINPTIQLQSSANESKTTPPKSETPPIHDEPVSMIPRPTLQEVEEVNNVSEIADEIVSVYSEPESEVGVAESSSQHVDTEIIEENIVENVVDETGAAKDVNVSKDELPDMEDVLNYEKIERGEQVLTENDTSEDADHEKASEDHIPTSTIGEDQTDIPTGDKKVEEDDFASGDKDLIVVGLQEASGMITHQHDELVETNFNEKFNSPEVVPLSTDQSRDIGEETAELVHGEEGSLNVNTEPIGESNAETRIPACDSDEIIQVVLKKYHSREEVHNEKIPSDVLSPSSTITEPARPVIDSSSRSSDNGSGVLEEALTNDTDHELIPKPEIIDQKEKPKRLRGFRAKMLRIFVNPHAHTH